MSPSDDYLALHFMTFVSKLSYYNWHLSFAISSPYTKKIKKISANMYESSGKDINVNIKKGKIILFFLLGGLL